MDTFDLKLFREELGLTQQEFADKIGYSQTIISRIEKGSKNITNKLLIKTEKQFKTHFKQFRMRSNTNVPAHLKEEIVVAEDEAPVRKRHSHSDKEAFEKKYYQLLEMKSKMDDKYYELTEEHKVMSMEMQLLKENNSLLKQILLNTEELLTKVKEGIK